MTYLISQTLILFLMGLIGEPLSHEPPSTREVTIRPLSEVGMSLSEEHAQTLYRGSVRVYDVKNKGSDFGQSFWVFRGANKIQAKYFASGEVFNAYSSWSSGKHIFLVCSGAFTSNNTPVGLTVDNGVIVNRKFDDTMDGLVIVYATGGIVVSDMDERKLYLQSANRHIDPRNANDKAELLRWAVAEDATIFQTQLLVFDNKIRFNLDRARTENAERRILVLAENSRGEVVHIVYNIQKGVYLGDVAQGIFQYLVGKKMSVIAMLNLDTGSYNILEVYDENRSQMAYKGNTQVSKATNLLVYHYTD